LQRKESRRNDSQATHRTEQPQSRDVRTQKGTTREKGKWAKCVAFPCEWCRAESEQAQASGCKDGKPQGKKKQKQHKNRPRLVCRLEQREGRKGRTLKKRRTQRQNRRSKRAMGKKDKLGPAGQFIGTSERLEVELRHDRAIQSR